MAQVPVGTPTNWNWSTISSAEIADNAVTDAKIGSRTIDDTRVPADNVGTLTELLSELANRIKAATGAASWRDNPAITLAALVNHKARHAAGGPDALTPADIGAVNKAGDTMTGNLVVTDVLFQSVARTPNAQSVARFWLPTDNPFAARSVTSLEYWDGTQWVPWAGPDARQIFDEDWGAPLSVPFDQRRFRVTLNVPASPLVAGFIFQSHYSGGANQNFRFTVETSPDGTTWTTRINNVDINVIGTEGLAIYPAFVSLGPGYWRFTFDFYNLVTGKSANIKMAAVSIYPGRTNNFPAVARFDRYLINRPLYIQGNIAWHAGNDGAGSGLDADLLDGMQPTSPGGTEANRVAATDASGRVGRAINSDQLGGVAASAYARKDVAETFAGDVTVNGTLVARAVIGHRLGDSTDVNRALSILNSGLGPGSTYYITLGKANSLNNQAEISYYHSGDGSSLNELRLGLYGNPDYLRIRADGLIMMKGVLDLNAVASARLVLPVGTDKYAV